MVRCNVTTESQPPALVVIHVGVFVDELYVVPCHAYDPHALAVSTDDVGVHVIVKCNVTTESHPAAFVVNHVGVFVDEVYVVPCHVYDPGELTSSIDVVGCLMVNANTAVESQPAAFVNPVLVYVPLTEYETPFHG
jgi:hypothetical protein